MILIILDRIKRVISIDDEKVYSEIAEDKGALVQAIIVVLLAGIIGVIWIRSDSWRFYPIPILIMSLVAWFIATGVMHIVAKLLGGKANFVSYLKAIGFARAPGAFWVIPYIGWLIGIIWVFASYFIATKVVHRLSTGKAIIIAVIVPILLMGLMIEMNIYSWMGLEVTKTSLFIAVIFTPFFLFSNIHIHPSFLIFFIVV